MGRRKMKCRASSETRFPKVSRQSEPSLGGKRPVKMFDFSKKCPPEINVRLRKSFLQSRLKRVSPKFHADRSHPRGVNGLGKNLDLFRKITHQKFVWARKIIFAKSSETCFPKVSRQSEPSCGCKRPLKILDFFLNYPWMC